jgi:hypothetical protein
MEKLKDIVKAIPNERKALYALLMIVALTGIIRIGLLGVPFQRDEGEYAYAGQLILQGVPPYQEVFNMKLPGIYAAYAFFMAIFGESYQGVHLALLVLNAITIVLVYFLAKQILLNQACALISAASFAVLSLGQRVEGIYANSEHFVIVFATGGLLLMLRGLVTERLVKLFLAGLLLGLGFLMKQHGIAFIALALVYIAYDSLRRSPILWRELILQSLSLIGGVLTVVMTLCIIMLWDGVFSSFWFWTVDYASAYISQTSADMIWPNFIFSFKRIVSSAPLLWVLVGLGFFALFTKRLSNRNKVFLWMYALFSVLSICPGFYFRPHYFVLLLPWAALFLSVAIYVFMGWLSRLSSKTVQNIVLIFLMFICLFQSIYKQRDYLFQMNGFQISRSTYSLHPFHESLEIAEFIKKHTDPDDRIAIFGSEPQIFFYSQRRSASSYIYMYPLMEKHDFALTMQRDYIKDIESANPKYLVYVNVPPSWFNGVEVSYPEFFQWLNGYINKGDKKLVGLIELFDEKSLYYWGQDVKLNSSSPYWVAIFERKT